jgi:hypothetical protein
MMKLLLALVPDVHQKLLTGGEVGCAVPVVPAVPNEPNGRFIATNCYTILFLACMWLLERPNCTHFASETGS